MTCSGIFFPNVNLDELNPFFFQEEEPPKLLITSELWEWCLKTVKIRKEDMNRLVMNLLVAQGYGEAVEIFQKESGTKRILF